VVAGERTLTARLVLVGDRRALAGTLQSEDGVERRFSGWMELAAAIEAWRDDAEASSDEGSTSRQPPRHGQPRRGGR
jgi:hypothetical protein